MQIGSALRIHENANVGLVQGKARTHTCTHTIYIHNVHTDSAVEELCRERHAHTYIYIYRIRTHRHTHVYKHSYLHAYINTTSVSTLIHTAYLGIHGVRP